ncbi:hypothetical protein EXE30_06795 [Acinetobacter halotolerans]|uniref:Uncharacterized protein n=1 Tax=Acinetobacter halotolerans TaxID=1752076 RepID=A0A4Q6XGW1_9GAMM|nr:hypothetical protein EXE30_06795 [Acinetobacter halotolerans]
MDIIESKKNLEIYKSNLSKLRSYNHLFSSYSFKSDCEREERQLKERIENLENALDKETKRNKKAAMR